MLRGKGTYVRALARDLGAALGVGGHLTALRRTQVGTFGIDEAETLDEAEKGLVLLSLDRVVRRCFATLTVAEAQASYVSNGRRLTGVILPTPRRHYLPGPVTSWAFTTRKDRTRWLWRYLAEPGLLKVVAVSGTHCGTDRGKQACRAPAAPVSGLVWSA